MFDKDAIKKELIEGSNIILKRYDEEDVVFLGSLRVYNEMNVKNIEKALENCFEDYGKVSIRSRKVVPCCSLPYFHISFHINVDEVI